jgi:hypothetical protein
MAESEYFDELLAERDALVVALERIRDRDWVENALDPQWASNVANIALGRRKADPPIPMPVGDVELVDRSELGDPDLAPPNDVEGEHG